MMMGTARAHPRGIIEGRASMSQPACRSHAFHRAVAALLLTSCLAACQGGNNADQAASSASSEGLAALPAPLPMSTTQPASTAVAVAAAPAALPAARPVRLGRLPDPRQGYAYLDRAYYQQDAVEDAPPDYAFDEGGVQPWVWQAGDNGRVICEPVAGGYRYYYYNPGASTPYLVRDPDRAYAYNDDVLVGVFTLAGALIDYGPQTPPALYGARYFDRGRMLWDRADNGPHQPMNAWAWDQRRRDLAARRAAWRQQMADNAAWSDWAASHGPDEQAYWQPIRAQHQQAAQAFDGWQSRRFEGPQPRFYGPPHEGPNPQPGPQPAAQPAPPPPAGPAPEHHPGLVGAAAVGAAGAAALAAHAMMQHHAQPAGPPPHAMQPHPAQPPAMVAAPHAAPAHVTPVHAAPVHAAPVHATAPHATAPVRAPVASEPAVTIERPRHAPPAAMAAPRAETPHAAPPHAAAPHAEAPHAEAPHPAPHPEGEREHDHHPH
jgi:hypothetical protein